MYVLKPKTLQPESKVALIAPSFSFNSSIFEQSCKVLEQKYKLKPVYQPSVFEQHQYLAGSDERRVEEFYSWMIQDDIDALFVIRGGYGCSRIYSQVLEKLKKHKKLKPKIIFGSSDFTIFLNGFFQDLGWTTFHGPVLLSRAFYEADLIEEQAFFNSIFTSMPLGNISHPSIQTLHEGQAEARIIGGCLALINSSLGTSYEVQTDNKILFLEDVTETPYRIDRMLTQLLHAGKLDKIKGLILGQFTQCGEPQQVQSAIEHSLKDWMKHKKVPVIFNFPAGHGQPQMSFPIGVNVELIANASNPSVIFLEAGTTDGQG